MISFTTRLAVGVSAISVSLVVLTGLVAYVEAVRAIDQSLDKTLVSMGQTAYSASVDRTDARASGSENRFLKDSGKVGYERVAWIEDKSGRVVARTSDLNSAASVVSDHDAHERAWVGTPSLGNISVDGIKYRAIYYPFEDSATKKPVVGVVGVSLAPRDASVGAIGRSIETVAGLTATIALMIGLGYASRVVGPLKRLSDQARAVRSSPERTMISLDRADLELADLAQAINSTVMSLEASILERDKLLDTHRLFVSDASHELRSPLANIQGTAEVALRRTRSGDEYEQALQTVLSETDRMAALVNDLLLLARSDAGGLQLELGAVDLMALGRQSIDAFSAQADSLGVALGLTGEPTVVSADARRLRQALDNLVANALRHARSNVMVRVHQNGISIRNDGPMIDPSSLPRIFDRFYRAEDSRSRETGGAGLGLAIVASILKAHGGSAIVRNLDQVEFDLLLPRSTIAGNQSRPSTPAGSEPLNAGLSVESAGYKLRFYRHFSPCLTGLASVMLLTLVNLRFPDLVDERVWMCVLLVSTGYSVWRGGLVPGLIVFVFSALMGIYFFLPPNDSFAITTLEDAVGVVIFVILGVALVDGGAALHKERIRTLKRETGLDTRPH